MGVRGELVKDSFVGQKTPVNEANHACVLPRGSGHCPHRHSLGSLWPFRSCFAETVRGHPVGLFGGNVCGSYWRNRFKRNLAFDGSVGFSNLDSWSRRRIRCGDDAKTQMETGCRCDACNTSCLSSSPLWAVSLSLCELG